MRGLFSMWNHRIQKALGLFAMGNHRIQKALALLAMGNHRSQMLGLFAIVILMQFGSFPACDFTKEWACDEGNCIDLKKRCDGKSNCKSDDTREEHNCQNFTCVGDMVKCGGTSGFCMAHIDRCDGKERSWGPQYCGGNGPDYQEGCDKYVCRHPYIQCPKSDYCVHAGYYRCTNYGSSETCNGTKTDEKYCRVSDFVTCISPWIKCPSGKSCMIKEWRCDTSKGCADKSDEKDCDSCNLPDDFKCSDGANNTFGTGRKCIHKALKCDGLEHCGDGSDEKGCVVPTSPSPRKNPEGSDAGNINGRVVAIFSAAATILILRF